MSEDIRAIEQEIESTAASLQQRTMELDEQVRGVATAVTTGAKLIGRRYPWALLGISVTAGAVLTLKIAGSRPPSAPKKAMP